jgi:hypothetical protein
MSNYTVKKQDNEFIVVNSKGIIIAYSKTKYLAEDIKQAQIRDDERHKVESTFNKSQENKALYAEFMCEFS